MSSEVVRKSIGMYTIRFEIRKDMNEMLTRLSCFDPIVVRTLKVIFLVDCLSKETDNERRFVIETMIRDVDRNI